MLRDARTTTGPPRYRGPDRRALQQPAATGPLRTVALIAPALATVLAGTIASWAGVTRELVDDWAAMTLAMAVTSAMVATGYAVATGVRRAAAMAGALWLLAASHGAAVLSVRTRASEMLLAVAALFAIVGVLGPEVDSRRRAGVVVPVTITTGGLVALLVESSLLPVAIEVPRFLAAGGWAIVALFVVTRGWATYFLVAVSSAASGTAVAALVSGAAEPGALTPAVAAFLAATTGMTIAASGAAIALTRAASGMRRRQHLLHLVLHEQIASAQLQRDEERHEMRNALLAAEVATTSLRRLAGSLDAAVEADLERAAKQGFLQLRALLEEDDAARQFTTVRLAGLLGRQAAVARALGVGMRITCPADVAVAGNPTALTQVLQNLVLNAARHGGASLQDPVEAEVRTTQAGAVEVRVSDRGPGVPQHLREQVFESGRSREGSTGQGLGLAVARRIAREHGGDLRLDDGPGATFVLSLPTVVAPEPGSEPSVDQPVGGAAR